MVGWPTEIIVRLSHSIGHMLKGSDDASSRKFDVEGVMAEPRAPPSRASSSIVLGPMLSLRGLPLMTKVIALVATPQGLLSQHGWPEHCPSKPLLFLDSCGVARRSRYARASAAAGEQQAHHTNLRVFVTRG